MRYTNEQLRAAAVMLANPNEMHDLIKHYPQVLTPVAFYSKSGDYYSGHVLHVGFGQLIATVTRQFTRLELKIDLCNVELGSGAIEIVEREARGLKIEIKEGLGYTFMN